MTTLGELVDRHDGSQPHHPECGQGMGTRRMEADIVRLWRICSWIFEHGAALGEGDGGPHL
jgi:hypothetical protein